MCRPWDKEKFLIPRQNSNLNKVTLGGGYSY